MRFAISLTEMLMRQQERKLREFPETKDETKAIPITPKRRGRARKRKRKDEDGDLVNLNGGESNSLILIIIIMGNETHIINNNNYRNDVKLTLLNRLL